MKLASRMNLKADPQEASPEGLGPGVSDPIRSREKSCGIFHKSVDRFPI